jgi:hypothetical protein
MTKIPFEKGWTKGINHYSWSFDLKYHTLEGANATANCLKNQFTPHDLCDESHEWWKEVRVQVQSP